MKKVISAVLAAAVVFVYGFAACPSVDAAVLINYKVKYSTANGTAYLFMTAQSKENKIYYTTDGTKPTAKSDKYTKKLSTGASLVVSAVEYNSDGKKVASIKLTLRARTAPVTFDYDKESGTVTMSTKTKDAVIYYTLDGTAPTKKSNVYSDKLTITESCTITAFADTDGLKPSSKRTLDVTVEEYVFPDYMVEMLEMINKERAEAGVNPLELDRELCEAAALRAEELITLYSHTRPDGRRGITAIDDLGIVPDLYVLGDSKAAYVGENIGRGQETVKEVVTKWFASVTHRNNIVLSKFSKIGFACAKNNDRYGFYWVQLFSS